MKWMKKKLTKEWSRRTHQHNKKARIRTDEKLHDTEKYPQSIVCTQTEDEELNVKLLSVKKTPSFEMIAEWIFYYGTETKVWQKNEKNGIRKRAFCYNLQ